VWFYSSIVECWIRSTCLNLQAAYVQYLYVELEHLNALITHVSFVCFNLQENELY